MNNIICLSSSQPNNLTGSKHVKIFEWRVHWLKNLSAEVKKPGQFDICHFQSQLSVLADALQKDFINVPDPIGSSAREIQSMLRGLARLKLEKPDTFQAGAEFVIHRCIFLAMQALHGVHDGPEGMPRPDSELEEKFFIAYDLAYEIFLFMHHRMTGITHGLAFSDRLDRIYSSGKNIGFIHIGLRELARQTADLAQVNSTVRERLRMIYSACQLLLECPSWPFMLDYYLICHMRAEFEEMQSGCVNSLA